MTDAFATAIIDEKGYLQTIAITAIVAAVALLSVRTSSRRSSPSHRRQRLASPYIAKCLFASPVWRLFSSPTKRSRLASPTGTIEVSSPPESVSGASPPRQDVTGELFVSVPPLADVSNLPLKTLRRSRRPPRLYQILKQYYRKSSYATYW